MTRPLNQEDSHEEEDETNEEEEVDSEDDVREKRKEKDTTGGNRPQKRVLAKPKADYCISLLPQRFRFFLSVYNSTNTPGFPLTLSARPSQPVKPTTNPAISMIRCGQLDDTYAIKKKGKGNIEMVVGLSNKYSTSFLAMPRLSRRSSRLWR